VLAHVLPWANKDPTALAASSANRDATTAATATGTPAASAHRLSPSGYSQADLALVLAENTQDLALFHFCLHLFRAQLRRLPQALLARATGHASGHAVQPPYRAAHHPAQEQNDRGG